MSDEPNTVEADVVVEEADGHEENGQARRDSRQPGTALAAPAARLAVTPQVPAAELVKRLAVIQEAADEAMKENVDYGKVPGTDKPTLLKPGAEKLGVLFQLDIQLDNAKAWGPGDHLTVNSMATVYHAPTGARLGFGEGICTTREKKYAKRRANRRCPECDKEAVLRSKHPPRDNPDAEPGWFCWKKKDGCGANFPVGDERITSQQEGEIENPDLPDTWNTVVKMAEKRARVDAVLAVTGASALFTQDVEDQAPAEATPTALHGIELDADSVDRVRRATAYLLAGGGAVPNEDSAAALLGRLTQSFEGYGRLPASAGLALYEAAKELAQLRDDAPEPVEAGVMEDPPPEPEEPPEGAEERRAAGVADDDDIPF